MTKHESPSTKHQQLAMATVEKLLEKSDPLEEAIRLKTAKIGVIGLGYVGLPLVQTFVDAGYETIGFDVDQRKIDMLMAGQSYIGHVDVEWIGDQICGGRFLPTSDMRRIATTDVVIICVPTPLTDSRDPNLTYVESTARSIAKVLRRGQLVILESTTYPSTTRDVVMPILEGDGMKVGKDFYLAYSPEREDPGNEFYSTRSIPKVVGGIEENSLRLAQQLYAQVVADSVPVSTCEVAEACKILENTYRAVNIAMVNELKMLFDNMGIDVWEVIEAAKTKPFGFQAFYPGPGLGGHCIPIDPFYLSWLARKNGHTTRFIELAGEINTAMPQYVIARLMYALNEHGKPLRGSRVCVLGVAYKRDVDDPRESPSFALIQLLHKNGAIVTYNDPHVPQLPKMRHYDLPQMSSEKLTPEFLAQQDCTLIATDHSVYDYQFIVDHSQLVVDTRNATSEVTQFREKICKA